MESVTARTVYADGKEIAYCLERKNVKNLNLRIRKDGNVFVSASKSISCEEIDEFVCGKASYVIKAANRFAELAQYKPQPKQYVSGETFTIELICFLVVR